MELLILSIVSAKTQDFRYIYIKRDKVGDKVGNFLNIKVDIINDIYYESSKNATLIYTIHIPEKMILSI